MARVEKFLFDRDFGLPESLKENSPESPDDDAEPASEEEIPPPPTFSEDELEDARTEAFAAGREQGLLAARDEVEALMGNAVDSLLKQLNELVKAHQLGLEANRKDAVKLATSVISKLFPELIRREGPEEFAALIEDLLPLVLEKPRVVIRIPEHLSDVLTSKISPVIERMGLGHQVTILGDENLTDGQGSIDWIDGGAERDGPALKAAIDEKVAAYLSAGTPPQGPGEDTEKT